MTAITMQEIAQIIALARRAPLQNMAEAEVASQLLAKLAKHFKPAEPVAAEPASVELAAVEKSAESADKQTPTQRPKVPKAAKANGSHPS